MDGFWKMVEGWSVETQFCAYALFLVAVVATAFLVLRTMTRTVLGYPEPAPYKGPGCNHDDNLTGRCLKVGGCRTAQECDDMIDLHGCEQEE